ncbi:MAG: hypothetical protein ACFFCS_06810 [Candidatus Hodarchaeota archaeon]
MKQKQSLQDGIQAGKDEIIGVRLPVIKIGISSLIVILSGMFPGMLVVYFCAMLFSLIPAGIISSIVFILFLPVLFWIVYFVYVLTAVLVTKLFLLYYHARSEPILKTLNRQFKDRSHPDYKRVHYYHMRGAIIKYTVWVTQKVPFPVLNQWVMKFYGTNKIGKRVLYEVCGVGMEFCNIGDDVVIEVGTALSSHVVDALYGNIILATVDIGNGASIGINSPIGPGTVLKENYHVGDNCMTFIKWPIQQKEGQSGRFFNGCPVQHCEFEEFIADDELKGKIREMRHL